MRCSTPGSGSPCNFFLKLNQHAEFEHEGLLVSRAISQQVHVLAHALLAHAEDATGTEPRKLISDDGKTETRLNKMYEPGTGIVPFYDPDNVPPPAYRIGDESYESHRYAAGAMCQAIPALRNLCTLLDVQLDLMDRTHNPSKQSVGDKEYLRQYRADVLADLGFMEAPVTTAVSRRAANLARQERDELRRAAAKATAADRLAENKRRAAAEAGKGQGKGKGKGGGSGGGRGEGAAKAPAPANRS